MTAEIRDRAANLPGGLTTLDAIHVATAEALGGELISFITYDRRMANVAEVTRAAGRVARPETLTSGAQGHVTYWRAGRSSGTGADAALLHR